MHACMLSVDCLLNPVRYSAHVHHRLLPSLQRPAGGPVPERQRHHPGQDQLGGAAEWLRNQPHQQRHHNSPESVRPNPYLLR